MDFSNSREEQFRFLKQQGFDVVEYVRVSADTMNSSYAEGYEKKIVDYDIPSDGLVLLYDDIEYGQFFRENGEVPQRFHSL